MKHKSFRLEMLQVARLAPKVLGDAAELVRDFLRTQQNTDGGFADRQGRSDLYYTVFGLETLLALQEPIPDELSRSYLQGFHCKLDLDFVHLCSLSRCAASIGEDIFDAQEKKAILDKIESYRTPDGGYHGTPGRQYGSAYGALLAYGAYADLSIELPKAQHLVDSIEKLRLENGGYANEPGIREGTTTSTAAAVVMLSHLSSKQDDGLTGEWLLKQNHSSGGFLATARAPLPDLLSTATALHALETLQVNYEHLKEGCLDFIDTLWSARGGFHGHWADDDLDVEYTSYGLLALGHLSN